MSFPLSPTNGQTTVLNGITYAYNSTKGAWVRVAGTVTATSVLSVTSATQSISTTTGALLVRGGVGIGGDLYVGGNIGRTNTTTTHPLEIIGSTVETTVLGAFRSLNTASSSLISFQNTSQAIVTVAGNTGSVLLVQASSQYLSIASNANLALGAGDFTVEGFYYITQGTVPDACLIDWRNGTNGGGVTQPLLEFQPSGSLGLNWYVNASNRLSSTNTPVLFNTWQHFAVSRVSGSTRMYLSGSQVGSTYTDANNYPQGSIFIGHANDGALGRYFPGYISNIRIIVGTGLYSGTTLTVPTANLSAVTNTRLLLNTINGGSFLADSSGQGITVTNNAAATSSAFAPFTGTSTTTYNDLVNIGSSGTNLVLQTNATTRVLIDSSGTVTVTSTAASTSTNTGALLVRGGVGIGGNINFGGNLYQNGVLFTGGGISTSTTSTFTILNTTSSTSTTTGALVVTGGVGVGGNINAAAFYGTGGLGVITGVNQYSGLNINATGTVTATNLSITGNVTSAFTITNATSATSTQTGALVVAGGLGVGGTVYAQNFVGGSGLGIIRCVSYLYSTNVIATNMSATSITMTGTSSSITGLTGIQVVNMTATNLTVTGNVTSAFTVTNATLATSTQTGALVVAGGAGFGGTVYASSFATNSAVGGTISGVTKLSLSGSTAATSSLTGALTVVGGVGIGGSLYAGNVFTNGQQIIPLNIQELTATAGQTVFTIPSGYTPGTAQVYVNGILFGTGDYTASNGTTISLTVARSAGDVVKVISGQTSTTPISSVDSLKSFSVAMSVVFGM